MNDITRLRTSWDASFGALALAAPERVFEELADRYREPHRAYHTLAHVAECFVQLEEAADKSCPAIGVALWFHDAIYDPRASDNEARSARWARKVLDAAGAGKAVGDTVERLIMATRHDAVPLERDARLLVDIDLSILGAPEARYREYEEQIRYEYDWVPMDAFRTGRARVLRSFLDREFIYNTSGFRQRLENRARTNLRNAIAALA